MVQNLLAIRICSPQKNMNAHTLCSIYTNPMLQAFFKKMKGLRLDYGVFSRKYGIQREGSNHQAYPSIEEISDEALVLLLKNQVNEFKDTLFLYWKHRPLTHTKYVLMLKQVGFQVIELRTLAEFEPYTRVNKKANLDYFFQNERSHGDDDQ